MLDRLINFEIKFLFFSNDNLNILITGTWSVFLMYSLYLLPNKEWLILIIGILVVWERILLVKIKRMTPLVK